MQLHVLPDPATRLTLLIADGSPAMREGLARLVNDECDLVVTGSAAGSAELRALVRRQAPEVLLLDVALDESDGLELVKDLAELAPGMRIVIFTAQPEGFYAERCLRAGAHAFVSKRAQTGELFRAIRHAADGGVLMPPALAFSLLSVGKDRAQPAPGFASRLTNRELQVFRLAGLALPTRAIAQRLGVSIKTIESHRENIKNKLDLASHSELVAAAAQWVRENGGA
ncbi:MAG TPA: response regulator transcription factor [Lacunisphaera sp.]|nr:response regulator transcription factor [Lacunisphaera sp.]